MAVSVAAAGDVELALGPPQVLFEAPRYSLGSSRAHYDVTPDGERFLVNLRTQEPEPIQIVLNWAAELER